MLQSELTAILNTMATCFPADVSEGFTEAEKEENPIQAEKAMEAIVTPEAATFAVRTICGLAEMGIKSVSRSEFRLISDTFRAIQPEPYSCITAIYGAVTALAMVRK